jgi:phosphoribosyl-AMP cyclohydrolase
MSEQENTTWLDEIQWNADGLVPAVARDCRSGEILTLAWMNREALRQTINRKRAVYWSRSKQRLWQKGESSGHTQEIQDIYLDCDKDAIVLSVIQTGGIACHTGRRSCFFHHYENGQWVISAPVLKNPGDIYKK